MKIQKISFIAYIILGIIIAWFIYDWSNPNYEKRFKQNSEEFANNRIQFEHIIEDIQSKYLRNEQKPNLTELSKKVTELYQEKLTELGIEKVEISYDEELKCAEKMSFKFNVNSGYNIRTLRTVQIIFSPCNEQTQKRFHINSGHIDVNGEGNNWLIISDTDFI
ncbi:MAG: hypothetical protein ACOH1O_14455 [Flavobacterium sp.]